MIGGTIFNGVSVWFLLTDKFEAVLWRIWFLYAKISEMYSKGNILEFTVKVTFGNKWYSECILHTLAVLTT